MPKACGKTMYHNFKCEPTDLDTNHDQVSTNAREYAGLKNSDTGKSRGYVDALSAHDCLVKCNTELEERFKVIDEAMRSDKGYFAPKDFLMDFSEMSCCVFETKNSDGSGHCSLGAAKQRQSYATIHLLKNPPNANFHAATCSMSGGIPGLDHPDLIATDFGQQQMGAKQPYYRKAYGTIFRTNTELIPATLGCDRIGDILEPIKMKAILEGTEDFNCCDYYEASPDLGNLEWYNQVQADKTPPGLGAEGTILYGSRCQPKSEGTPAGVDAKTQNAYKLKCITNSSTNLTRPDVCSDNESAMLAFVSIFALIGVCAIGCAVYVQYRHRVLKESRRSIMIGMARRATHVTHLDKVHMPHVHGPAGVKKMVRQLSSRHSGMITRKQSEQYKKKQNQREREAFDERQIKAKEKQWKGSQLGPGYAKQDYHNYHNDGGFISDVLPGKKNKRAEEIEDFKEKHAAMVLERRWHANHPTKQGEKKAHVSADLLKHMDTQQMDDMVINKTKDGKVVMVIPSPDDGHAKKKWDRHAEFTERDAKDVIGDFKKRHAASVIQNKYHQTHGDGGQKGKLAHELLLNMNADQAHDMIIGKTLSGTITIEIPSQEQPAAPVKDLRSARDNSSNARDNSIKKARSSPAPKGQARAKASQQRAPARQAPSSQRAPARPAPSQQRAAPKKRAPPAPKKKAPAKKFVEHSSSSDSSSDSD